MAVCHTGRAWICCLKCQLIGLHGNDRWFDGKSRRTYLKDNGTRFKHRTEITRQAHEKAFTAAYQQAAR